MKINLFKKSAIALATFGLAASVFAQLNAPLVIPQQNGANASVGKSLQNLIVTSKGLLGGIYGMMFTIALLVFFYGIIKLLLSHGEAKDKQEAYKFLGFGIVALFVMVGVWGLVGFLSGNLGIGVGGDIPIPSAPINGRIY
jgi:hypothetical protein